MQPKEVFLSHSSQDAETASHIARVLRENGVPTFFSPHNILGAQQWHDEIGSALKRCDWFLILLSENAIQSKWVKWELHYALRTYVENRIVPLSYQACDYDRLSWTLDGFQMIDFSGEMLPSCRNLLRVWGLGLKDSG